MDTSEFRKPRPDYPIVPETALYRKRVKGFRAPKGRRGKKPRGKRKYEKPEGAPIPDRLALAKTQEIKENAKDRRDRLRLEQETAREQIRYRERKAEREERQQAVRVIEGRRVQQRQDRLIQDQARHFTDLLQRGERRSGEIQAQYQEFIQQVLSQRNLGDAPTPIPIRFAPAGGSLFEEEEEAVVVGSLRKPEVVRPSRAVQQSFMKAGLSGGLSLEEVTPPPTPVEDVEQASVRLRQREQEQAKQRELRRTQSTLASPRLRTAVSELRETIGPQPKPQIVLEQSSPLAPAALLLKEQQRTKFLEGGEAGGGSVRLERTDRDATGAVPRRTKPQRPAPETPKAPIHTRFQPSPEPEPSGAPDQPAQPAPPRSPAKARSRQQELAEFLRDSGALYQASAEGKNQTAEQIKISDEVLMETGALKNPITWDKLSAEYRGIATKLGATQGRSPDDPVESGMVNVNTYLRINDAFDKTGAGKQAGIYRVSQYPATNLGRTGNAQRAERMYLSSVFGGNVIATINPYKEVGGVNRFERGLEEGKAEFFVLPKEGEKL